LESDHSELTDRAVAAAYAEWFTSKGIQVFGTVNTLYPLSLRQHLDTGRRLQELYGQACGERPTVMVPCQRNPTREGYHSHPSLFGSDELLTVDRSWVWAKLMDELRYQRGSGVDTVRLASGWSRVRDPATGERVRGSHDYRRPEVAGERIGQVNRPRVRLEPVLTAGQVLAYATRYASREVDSLEVLTGDRW
jgi:hypothetical protein